MLLIHRASTHFRSVAPGPESIGQVHAAYPSASIAKLRSTPLVWRPEPAAWPLPQWPARAPGPGSGCWVGKSGCWRRRPSTCGMPSTVSCVWDMVLRLNVDCGWVCTSVYIYTYNKSINQPSTRHTPDTTRVHPADSRRARWAYGMLIGSIWPLVRSVAIWGMIVLSFFEMPTWCLQKPDACHPGTDLSAFYPR